MLRDGQEFFSDRVWYLTVTPMDDWGEHGSWLTLPGEFHETIADIAPGYRPASEAYLRNSHVRQKWTSARAWMRWVTINRWISDTKVEVEEGVWTGPLGGGAATVIYEKVDGEWRLENHVGSWTS